MRFDEEQSGIIAWSGAAILVTTAVLGACYLWMPPGVFGLSDSMATGDRIAFALKWELPVFLWLAGCVRAVASQRFREPADRKGAAYSKPTPRLAIRAAILPNSLEQTVIAVGAASSYR